ncbi:MAG: hypothetical protein BZY88_18850 [SAR202 cluster bacterium Io17-Chloro-G9]|nr:MAG: hypothetical protein BZY88_18850 [SAR202 cluster bacterium Io17-Chloro-G9]
MPEKTPKLSPDEPKHDSAQAGTDSPSQEVAAHERPVDEEPTPQPPLDWMDKTLQWGVRVKPGKKGLTVDSLNVGIYGEVPEFWEEQTRMPRGAYPAGGVPPIGYSLRYKHEMWADNAAGLYEEAVQRRWIPATDVPWDTIPSQPDDVQAAMAQICTELSQQANVEIESIGYWMPQMSYGYHEVKLYLATELMDAARHLEVFRKRALINGGGLGLESSGGVNRMILESRGGWSETSLFLHLLRGTFTMTLYRYGEAYATNPADKYIFGRCLQDKSRHLAYGLNHLRYAITHAQDKALIFQRLLAVGEAVLARDLNDPVLSEALAVVMGGGLEGAQVGMGRVRQLMGDFVGQYLRYAEQLGISREQSLSGGLARFF